jgi:hypothetical protein
MDLCPIAVLRESYGLNVEVDGVVHLRRVPCMCFIYKQPEDSDFLEPLPFSPRQKLQWATYQNKARLDVKQLLEVCQVSPGLFLCVGILYDRFSTRTLYYYPGDILGIFNF